MAGALNNRANEHNCGFNKQRTACPQPALLLGGGYPARAALTGWFDQNPTGWFDQNPYHTGSQSLMGAGSN